jgi:hypothetical protein
VSRLGYFVAVSPGLWLAAVVASARGLPWLSGWVCLQRKAAEHLRAATKLLADDAAFSLDKGYAWASLTPDAAAASSEPALGPRARLEAAEKRRRVLDALTELAREVRGPCCLHHAGGIACAVA